MLDVVTQHRVSELPGLCPNFVLLQVRDFEPELLLILQLFLVVVGKAICRERAALLARYVVVSEALVDKSPEPERRRIRLRMESVLELLPPLPAATFEGTSLRGTQHRKPDQAFVPRRGLTGLPMLRRLAT